MWMSERAAVQGVEDGRVDELDDRTGVRRQLVDVEDLFAVLVLGDDGDLELFRRLLQHALGGLALLEDLVDGRLGADGDLDRHAEQHLQLVDHEHVGRDPRR
jgi:hypothetical protein